MAYYMSCDINGCCSIKLSAVDEDSAIDEGYARVKEAYEEPSDLDDACGIDSAGMSYPEACDAFRLAGASCVSESGVADGCDIWLK